MTGTRSKRRNREGGRARRFPIQAPVHYRANDGLWRHGTTENISRSGLLFRVEEALPTDTPVEFVVELPTVLHGERNARVVCRGRVVRSEEPPGDLPGMMLAAAITSYQFNRLDPKTPSPFGA